MFLYLTFSSVYIQGYQGLVDGGDNIVLADWKCVSGIIHLVSRL